MNNSKTKTYFLNVKEIKKPNNYSGLIKVQ